jgi:hypothetical protein
MHVCFSALKTRSFKRHDWNIRSQSRSWRALGSGAVWYLFALESGSWHRQEIAKGVCLKALCALRYHVD